jgi:LacI family transcriptional regulator
VKAVDVARRAGVSVATVSLVVNGKAGGRVSEATQQLVRRTVTEMGYRVNPAARSLVTGRRYCVALAASDLVNPFISTIASGVAAALGADYQLLLALSAGGRETPDVEQVLAFGVDGVLIDFPGVQRVRQVAPECPVVALDDPAGPSDTSAVRFGLVDSTRALARHLCDLGHHSLVYLDAIQPWPTFRFRRTTLWDQLRKINPEATLQRVRTQITIDAARQLVHREWPQWDQRGVTALVAASDLQAYGALTALAELDVDVPGRVSVASFDGLAFSAITSPALTTVTLPAFELGFEGATLLKELIERGDDTVRTVELPTRFVIRGSTGPSQRFQRRDAPRSRKDRL